jgi:DNA-binding NtrC family response regulator
MASQKTPTTPDQLAQAIDSLVTSYVDEARRVAHAALDHAFANALSRTARSPRPRRRPDAEEAPTTGRRRSSAEIAEVKERLYAAVCSKAGESMTVFAEALGLPLHSLQRPMSRLRAEGKVRCVGERNMARYFPALGRRAKAES